METGGQNALTLNHPCEPVLLLSPELTFQSLVHEPGLWWSLDGPLQARDAGRHLALQACLSEVARPKPEHDSFAMHAPLELMARVRMATTGGMRDLAEGPSHERLARLQAVATALAYRDQGPASGAASLGLRGSESLQVMGQAIESGDVQQAQSAAMDVAASLSASAVVHALAPDWSRRLACGAHAHVFLSHLVQLHACGAEWPQRALQALPIYAGELARHPTHSLPDAGVSGPVAGAHALRESLLATEALPGAASGSIQRIVQQAMDAGVLQGLAPCLPAAAALSDDSLWQACMAAVCEVALRSMLEDQPAKAKYGWTHTLTLPLALWHLAQAGALGRGEALQVAALQVAAFRAVIGSGPMPQATPNPHHQGPCPEVDETFKGLFAQACTRPDAHLVKYVLACRDLGHMAPSLQGLGCQAAKHLTAIWVQEQPDAGLVSGLSLR